MDLNLPLLPLRDIVVFPGMIVPLFVGRDKSVVALEKAMAANKEIFLVAQLDPAEDDPGKDDLYDIGVTATIMQLLKLPDGTVRVLVEGKQRAQLRDLVEHGSEYVEAAVSLVVEQNAEGPEATALMRSVADQFENYSKLNKKMPAETAVQLSEIETPSALADAVAANIQLKVSDKQSLLVEANPLRRLEMAFAFMEGELGVLQVEKKIRGRVKRQMEKTQREYYLNEQMKAIQRELGNDDGEGGDEAAEIQNKIDTMKLSKEAKAKANAELKKLRGMAPMSAEATVVRNYLDTLLGIPWGKKSKLKRDIAKAQDVLDEDHFALEKVKDRIVEYLAVQARTNKLKGPILCLVGPPGVGKTSLGKSIAKATGREFIRQSLGGVRDEAEIRGHRRTYIGSMPGKVAANLKKAGTMNPLFLLDEIDKLGQDFRGDPASALLEVLDPEQNNKFNDHYLEIDLDLSDVMFVTTANSLNLPQALLDRMEIIRLEGYTEDEKLEIAKRHLFDKQVEAHGLKPEEFSVSDDALRDLIRYYTREAGVRTLEREVAKLARKALRRILEGKATSIAITPENLADFSGVRKYRHDMGEEENQIGAVTGLAWTEVGGELLTIEAVTVPGKGQIKTTGKLGEVMSESIQAALSYVKARAPSYGIKPSLFGRKDVHIHLPEGAVPKDGPSAGIGMVTCIVSTLTGIAVHRDVAMTGEVTLRGRVLPIGGLKEKLLAALRGGIKTVLIPQENEKDLADIPANIKEGLEIIPVSHVDQVLARALVSPLVAVEWTEADELAAALPPTVGGENGASVTH
ncbi:MAG: endopeptidase La [Sphingomonadales bacterium 35-56-22]|jgi:ATP-dependent Lon protease|uniref:endopeptidase La n=1 Tax=Sphingorhabdus sp. TaxID=1902408 RepID=UPI000BD44FCC|nr:endopeptidase La [Sphingorhabdus sp.]OYY16515.1 MAG: endopeptidase La [Sphingomonadales bacterium 35-56-22]OYY98282.1 MAG: endopeptidase La [Sphingomonadales bacterium 28-56-43]OYZ60754.1 MAG: endopeptidase La [Sphingomonadales bacterium 24-56-14]OZA83697.1 MAG: endopeptidase La [Sphingomonadales bacterium 39-57-19]HQS11937.1 endopeptidase La [Sphingorhabdus sp.]